MSQQEDPHDSFMQDMHEDLGSISTAWLEEGIFQDEDDTWEMGSMSWFDDLVSGTTRWWSVRRNTLLNFTHNTHW